jgi:hypothetical protein
MPADSQFGQLLQKSGSLPPQREKAVESELDVLLARMEERQRQAASAGPSAQRDPVETVREFVQREFRSVFEEVAGKYAAKGITMQVDVANLLSGGRNLQLEFAFREYRSVLLGTVTPDAVAFEERRFAPNVNGELVSGPSLRIRGLNAATLREFLCERLAILLKTALRLR